MKKISLFLILSVFMLMIATGCTPDNPATRGASADSSGKIYAEVTDSLGRDVVLKEKPKRIVVLSPSMMNFVDALKGKVVGRPSARVGEVPAAMENVPEVGHVYNINIEKVVSLAPDLVLLNAGQHEKFIKLLDSNNIKSIALQPKTYEDVKRDFMIIGKIYGKKDKAEKKIGQMDAEIKSLLAKIPHEKKRVVIIHATPSNVTVELKNSIAGCVADILGFDNVAADAEAMKGRPDKTPYSMEALVEKNPEIIFITSMGKPAKIEKRLKADVKSNPSWNSLEAVKENRVYILPENLFLLNPGLDYPEAVRFMSKTVYPEAF